MKTLFTLLLFSTIARADIAPFTIPLSRGHGQVTPTTAIFSLHGLEYTFTNAHFSDFSFSPGLHQCNRENGCDLSFYEQAGSVLLYQSGYGTGLFQKELTAWDGSLRFSAISFTSSLDSGGRLLLSYLANADVLFIPCRDLTCADAFGVNFVMHSSPWRIHAWFDRADDGYRFDHASFRAVPEPSTWLMTLPSLAALWWRVRRIRYPCKRLYDLLCCWWRWADSSAVDWLGDE